MKKNISKQAKKASKLAKAENLKKKQAQFITVKNAEGDPDTTAEILIQNKIDYTPKVSVIIPVYNVEPYLRECLDSVVNQTLKEIEIICVDDGSTDNSLDILKEYAKKDKRMTVIRQQNLHAGVARNAGLSQAKGEYLSFLDSDDFFELNMLEEMSQKADEDDADVVVCKYQEFNLRANVKKIIGYKEDIYELYASGQKDLFYKKLYNFCSPVPWNKMYRHEFISSHSIRFQNTLIANDIYMFLIAFSMAENISTIGKSFIHYRKFQKNSLMSRREQNFLIPFEPYNKFRTTVSDNIFNKVKLSFDERLRSIVDLTEPWVADKKYYYFKLIDYTKKANEYVSRIILECIKNKAAALLMEYREVNADIKSITDEQLENMDKIFEKNVLVSRLRNREYFRYLSKNPHAVEEYAHITQKPECAFIHGSGTWSPQPETIEYAIENNIPLVKMEDGFLRSADTWCNLLVDVKYIMGIAFTFTNDVFYFDATQSSFMERQINNKDFKLSKEQKKRAQNAIKTIIDNHLTKYNHQPIFEPKIGREGVKKILVVDQSYGDFSIKQGLADDNTFAEMLEAAIKENPDADIIIKTHPDAIAPGTKKPLGYYSTIVEHDNIYLMRQPINPISLLKYVDKVYVCTTQFGFEALMCGKEVHTFGMPFYAGWGLTIDKLKNPRRTARRTLEEIFYIAYIKNTYYVDPVNKCPCNIERAMEYLIELREEYRKYLTQPKVSVIIPVYNVEQYLRECLDSVVNQTLKDIEIICVNDGSPDNSAKILKEYTDKDKRIKIYENTVNKGLGYSRNLGVEKANGRYIFFLDSDDFIKSETLENLYKKSESTEADLCQYLILQYNDKTKKEHLIPSTLFNIVRTSKKISYDYKLCPKLIFERVEAPLKLYKKDFLLKNNIKFFEGCYFEDTIVHIKCMSLAKKICFEDNAYYYYRKNREGQITGNSENTDKFLDIFNYINEAEKFFKQQNMWKEIKPYYYTFAVGRICSYYVRCNDKTKVKFAKKAALWAKNKKLSELKQSCPDQFELFYAIIIRNNAFNKFTSYLLFPYYALRLPKLKKKYLDAFAKKLPSVLTEFRVDIKNIGKAINAVGVAAAKATITQPSWATNASGIGQVVSGETRKQKINIKAINSGKLTLNFRGQDKRDENKTRIPLWCDYKSIKIDGKKINDKTVQTWHDQPFKYEMPVKDGQEVELEIEQAYHKYTKTELKNLLLKLNANSNYVIQNIDKLTDAVYKNIYPEDVKSTKVVAKDKQSSFKHFLYHKVKTDSYTKTYVCGIRVKKKPANIYEFIDKRIEALSKNWEGKFAAVVNSGAANKKELLTKMTSLNTACQKELKATGTSLEQDIAALAKETSLIKSNSLYMIKSLNDKMAEVMGGQTVAAETLQVIQAENTAEILASMAKVIATQATAQDALQQSGNANRTAILDELTKLPESLTKKSEANKAAILSAVAKTQTDLQQSGNTNRTAILDELTKLPESMSKNSAANKAEILANVTQMTETAKANRTAILDELAKLPENLAKNSVVNKNEIIESINDVTQKQQRRIDNLINSLKQYYVSRTKTDNYSLEFRTFADMADCIRKNLKKIPENVDLVVGIPRSGMIPAYIIALFMNKKCCSLDEFLAGSTGSNGNRKMNTSEINNILVIDDSVYNGTEMGRTREKLAPLADKYHFTYATVYVKPDSEDKVDVWMERVSAPRVWQWNYLNHSIAQKACFDMDGVLCIDPTPDENDDGEKYLEFIAKAKPLYIPTYEINTIVTSRLEKYREPTEKWLKDHGVKYKQLIMLDLPTAEERRKLSCHAKFKAEVYKNLADTVLFVESEPNQAREIALLTGKTVICTSTDEVY